MVSGAAIVASAQKYAGVPYSQRNPQSIAGLDCSGMVQFALRDVGINGVARNTVGQLAQANTTGPGKNIGVDLGKAAPGDVLHYLGHEEIWVGGGKVFSEATDGTVAAVRNRTPWTITGIVRYSDMTDAQLGGTLGGDGAGGGPVTPPVDPAPAGILAFVTNGGMWARVAVSIGGAAIMILGIVRMA